MENMFSFRMDKRTSLLLNQLAVRTYRSRASVIRWLIYLADQNPNLVVPIVEVSGGNQTSSQATTTSSGE